MNLVTGGSGYFGETIVKQLLAAGQDVRILDLNPLDGACSSDVEVLIGDIRDPKIVSRACQGVNTIYHNVAQVPLAKDKQLFDSVNREGTRIMLEQALNNEVPHIVYTSSSAVYGIPQHNPVTEFMPCAPREDYGQAKLSGEALCLEFVQKGLNISVIRPRTILGHGRLGIFQILFEWIYQGWNIPVFGNGENVYQFIHAEDLASACIKSATLTGFQVFNIGTNQFGTMRASLEALIAHAGTKSKIRPLPMRMMEVLMKIASQLGLSPLGDYHALMYGRSLYFDCSKATQELGWKPTYSNIDMLCQSYDWYCANRESVLNRDKTSVHRSAVKQGILRLMKYVP